MTEPESGVVQIPLEFRVQEDLECRYATNMVVQHTEHEFIISFFSVTPPLVVGPPEQRREQLAHVTSVPAEGVARVIVAASRMPEFVRVLSDSLETYLARDQEEE